MVARVAAVSVSIAVFRRGPGCKVWRKDAFRVSGFLCFVYGYSVLMIEIKYRVVARYASGRTFRARRVLSILIARAYYVPVLGRFFLMK